MNVAFSNTLNEKGIFCGVITAEGVSVKESPEELLSKIQGLLDERQQAEFPPADLKKAVRDMLRTGGFKPSGRSKPASEYLAKSAEEGNYPCINNLVDINNYISLKSGLPVSMLDLDKTSGSLLLRFGLEGESYIFNSADQTIDLKGLISVCRNDSESGTPLGNPVKDSMEAKLTEGTSRIVGIIYCPENMVNVINLESLTEEFKLLVENYASASSMEMMLV